VHCVVPGGGLSPDHRHWISCGPKFFLPVKVLRRVFRGKFLAALERAFEKHKLTLAGQLAPLQSPTAFAALLRTAARPNWVVYAKPPFAGPAQVLTYLSRYTHRIAIANSRLMAMAEGKVTFRWRDYAHGCQTRTMTLEVDEFLRRFLLHVLPASFVRIRYFGLLANRHRTHLLNLCRSYLRTAHHHRLPSALGISVNTVVVAPCEWLRPFLPPNFPHGYPTHLKRRILHDPSSFSFDAIHVAIYTTLPISAEPEVCADSPTRAPHVLSSSYGRLSRSDHHDHCCLLTQIALSSQPLIPTRHPHPVTPISDSKHITPAGGFDQPTLSLMLRP
jgi:hypothetical protein